MKFGGNRMRALERDNWSCVKCGMTNDEHKKRFGYGVTVDHKDGNGEKSKKPNHELSNLQTLCSPCHGKKDGGRQEKRAVKAIRSDGTYRIFNSIVDANIALNVGKRSMSIYKCATGGTHSAWGYKWEYLPKSAVISPADKYTEVLTDKEKKMIADKIEKLLLKLNNPKMSKEKPVFHLHVKGKDAWSWIDIKRNWKSKHATPSINAWNKSAREKMEHI